MAGLLKSIIGATGIGPASNLLQRHAAKGLNNLDRKKINSLLSKISEDAKAMRGVEKEVADRSGSWYSRLNKTIFDSENKQKLQDAEKLLDKLRRATSSREETVSNLQKGISARNKNIQDLLEDYPRQLGNTGTFYGAAGLGGGGYYGANELLSEEE